MSTAEKLRELELSLSRRPLSSTSLNGFTLIYLLEVYLPSPVTLKVRAWLDCHMTWVLNCCYWYCHTLLPILSHS